MYKKIIDPEESYVSDLLKEGYSLHSVTPIMRKSMSYYDTRLVYHFIKEYARASEEPLSGLKFKAGYIEEKDKYDNINWHENQ